MKEVSTQMRVETRLGNLCLILCFILLSVLSLTAKAQSPTAPALNFNVFLQKGATLINNETEGPVALGGDLTLSQNSYQVSTNYLGTFKVNNVPVTLVIGGKVNYNGGNGISVNQNGYVKIGSAGTSKVWYTDNNNAYSPIRITPGSDYNGSPRINLQANAQQLGVSANNNPVFQSGVVDFDAAFAKFKASSSSLSACKDNAVLTDPNGNILPSHSNLPGQVKINLQTGTNTLNLNGSELNNVQIFTYNNTRPDASHVLVINVNAAGTFNWNVWNSSGVGLQESKYVLYNFYNTTYLNIQSGAAVEGTVFAPFADINKTGNQSNIEGQIIAQSYIHNGGENHYAVFDPSISGCAVTCNLSLSGIKTDISCYGAANGAINMTASGASGAVSYLWNDNITTEDRINLAAGNYSVQATDAAGCKASSSVFTISQPSAISIGGTAVNTTTVNGKNGSIDITATGGTAPYTYKWNDGATTEDRTGLYAGSYSVTVTDKNGCTAGKSFTITDPVCNLSATATKTNVSCNGSANGSIDVTTTGSNGTVTYLWNDGATTEDRNGLKPGSYCVQATDTAGCKVTTPMYVISEPAAIAITGTVVNTTTVGGKNGSIDITVTGGTVPYTYKWNDGATTEDRKGLKAGTYTVVVTDKNGCSNSKSFIVAGPSCNIKITSTIKPVCCYGGNDGAIDITVSNTKGKVSYAWKDGPTTEDRTNLSAGTYSVKVTDSVGCTASAPNLVVKQPTQLQATSTVTGQTSTQVCDGTAKISATGGTAPYTCTWCDGYKGASRSNLCMGTYQVTVTDKNGCTVVITVKIPCPGESAKMSIAALASTTTNVSAEASVSPNPTTGLIRVSLTAQTPGNAMIVVYDLSGKALLKNQFNLAAGTNQQQVDLSSLVKGLYQVQIVTGDGSKIFKVILK